jgi:hypothetical protein
MYTRVLAGNGHYLYIIREATAAYAISEIYPAAPERNYFSANRLAHSVTSLLSL